MIRSLQLPTDLLWKNYKWNFLEKVKLNPNEFKKFSKKIILNILAIRWLPGNVHRSAKNKEKIISTHFRHKKIGFKFQGGFNFYLPCLERPDILSLQWDEINIEQKIFEKNRLASQWMVKNNKLLNLIEIWLK